MATALPNYAFTVRNEMEECFVGEIEKWIGAARQNRRTGRTLRTAVGLVASFFKVRCIRSMPMPSLARFQFSVVACATDSEHTRPCKQDQILNYVAEVVADDRCDDALRFLQPIGIENT